MRAMFLTGGSKGAVFPQAPLARAALDAGHRVIMAGPEMVVPTIAMAALPPVSVSPRDRQALSTDQPDDPAEQMRYVGRWYAELALQTREPLLRLAEQWRPDVVVGGGIFYSAALLARELGLPAVQQPWGLLDSRVYDEAALEVLRPALAELGLDAVPEPDIRLDVAPPSLRDPDAPAGRPIRWIPGNQYRPLEPWMYTKGAARRVLLTSGSRVSSEGTLHTIEVAGLRLLAERLGALGVEVVVAVPDEVAPELRGPDGTGPHAGWIPLDVVAPTCDLVVHHGGTGTNMTAMAAGVPQVIVREIPSVGEMEPQVRMGAVIDLPKGRQSTDDIVDACRTVLADPGYAESAGKLAAEIAAMPPPAEVVGDLERLAAG